MKNTILMGALALSAPLLAEMNVLALSGSTREGSFNKKLMVEAAEIASSHGARVTIVDIRDYPMPFYDADLEKRDGLPPNAKKLRDLMLKSDAILISSPEYNASFPGVLKNAIDWLSRNENAGPSTEAFKGKKFALMSASPGKGGGARGLSQLTSVIECLGGEVLPLKVAIGQSYSAFDETGHLVSRDQRGQLEEQMKLIPAKKQG